MYELDDYDNIEVEFVPGMQPTAYFQDIGKKSLFEVKLDNLALEPFLDLLVQKGRGFLPRRKYVSVGGEPYAMTYFGDHSFSLYMNLNYRYTAKNFASEQSLNGKKGRIFSIPCPELEVHLEKWLAMLDVDTQNLEFWVDLEEKEPGVWKDSYGRIQNYLNWQEGEPNNARKSEHCATAKLVSNENGKKTLRLYDVACPVVKAYFLVEFGDKDLDCSNPRLDL